ncbi:MAG: hypothetical protein VKI81_03195 [Synechococcaceae cyanobacterium]|nr:hypothetical protein [Synechococcaceae cyanobacterium]
MRRWLARSLLLAATPLLAGKPALALEELELRLPLLDTNLVVRLDELTDHPSLWEGSSDLAEHDRATDGAFGRMARGLRGSVGSPLLHEALLATTALMRIDGVPTDLSGADLCQPLRSSERKGTVTFLSLLRALPDQRAAIDLLRAVFVLERLQRQQAPGRERTALC